MRYRNGVACPESVAERYALLLPALPFIRSSMQLRSGLIDPKQEMDDNQPEEI